MLKNWKWPLLGLLLVSLVNCSPTPPDVPVCENLTQYLSNDDFGHIVLVANPICEQQIKEAECGHCVNILSGKESFIGESVSHQLYGKPWSKVRKESIFVPPESYASLATYIINSCKKAGCNSEVDKFKIKLNSLYGVAAILSSP